MQFLYVLHFNDPHHHAKHYIGATDNLNRRLAQHRAGHGANLTKVIIDSGNDFVLAAAYQLHQTNLGEKQNHELRTKQSKNGPRYCPICSPNFQQPKNATIIYQHQG